MEAARCCDEDTAFLAKKATERPLKASAADSSPAEADTATPDDDFVVMATYDGHWNPVASADN